MNPLLNPILLGKILRSYLFDINRIWKYSEEEIKKYQDKQLRQIVKYAYSVPIYHEKYRDAGIHPRDIRGINDIEKLPFVTKRDLRGKKAEVLLPKGANIKKYSMASTSGSTGQPVTLYSDPYTVFKTFIGFIRMIREHDINWRKTRMALIADLSPDSAEEIYFRKTALPNLKLFFNIDNIQAFHVGEKPEKLIKQLEKFNPEFIGGYPGILNILAILKRQGQGKNLTPRALATSGAIVDDYTRKYISKAFDADVFDVYGATECSPMAFQCRNGNYHIHSDFAYIEFMDAEKKEIASGDGGNIVVTRLFGQGTPVVRYTGISDFLVETKRKCDCNISTPIIEKIEGRQVDSIVLPGGGLIPPSSFTGIPHHVMHNLNTDKINRFQIIQHTINEVEILIVIDKDQRNVGPKVSEIKQKLKKAFEKKLGNGIRITVNEVEQITMVRSGSATPPPVAISKVKKQQ